MPILIRIASAALAMLLFAAAPVRAEMTPEQKAEIGDVIREYLLANPEVLEEAINALRDKRAQAAAMAQADTIQAKKAEIFDSQNQVVLGNPDGAITLVEFFDYNCGYCRRALSDMTALMEANPDLRVVLKEFPILSEGSMEAARVAAAVETIDPKAYLDFHLAMFTRPGEANAAKALEVARDVGLDVDAVKKVSEDASVTANISEVRDLANALGITGTPSYVIGNELVPGAIGYDGLQEKVTAMRKCGTTVC